MRQPKIPSLFPILVFSFAVQVTNGYQPDPLPVFKDQSPYYGHSNGHQRVEHIFNLLADVPQASEVTALEEDQPEYQSLSAQDFFRPEEPDHEFHYSNAIDDSSIVYNEEDNVEKNDGSYMGMLRSFVKKSLHATKKVKDVFDTVQKVTRIYQDERRKIVQNATVLQRMGLQDEPEYDPNASTAGALLNVALDPPSIIKMVEVSRSSTSEDDILEGLTSVLLGAEARQSGGSALTLDPVTIIALLTLAAYLIRAVYQILANNSGRSLGPAYMPGLPFGLSELPDYMVTIHNYISGTDYSRQSYARSLQEAESDPNSVQGVMALPGSLAAFTKLVREGHQGCARLYVCDQLAARSLFSYSLEDLVVAGLGYYYADADLWGLLMTRADEGHDDICASHRARCGETTLSEARRIRDLFTEASSKLVRFWGATTVAKKRSLARAATSRGRQTEEAE